MVGKQPLSPRKRPIQARARQTVEAVLEAAAQVFEAQGYARGTTNRIAERAGVSVGSLYQYFPNKDAILVALLQQHVEEAVAFLTAKLAEAVQDPPPLEQLLQQIVTATVQLHSQRPGLHRVLFEEAPKPPAVLQQWQSVEQQLIDLVASLLLQAPEVHVTDPQLAAYVVVHATEHLSHEFVLHPAGPFSEEQFVDEVVKMLRGYLIDAGKAGDVVTGLDDAKGEKPRWVKRCVRWRS